MSNYLAIKALNYKGSVILKGQRVPQEYPRLDEGIKRGWIVEDSSLKDDSPAEVVYDYIGYAEKPPSSASPEDESEEEITLEVPAETVEVEQVQTEPPLRDIQCDVKDSIDKLDFLTASDRIFMRTKGIELVLDLGGYSVEALCKIPRIGKTKALRLVEIYDQATRAKSAD